MQFRIQKHRSIFSADQNLGLIEQVAASQVKTMVKRLTKTFVTLSLSELANRVGLSAANEAEKLIVNMVDEGSIQAKISQKDGMVRFDSEPEQFDSIPMLKNLEENINACITLDGQLQAMEEEILLNPNFIKKNASAAQNAGT